MKKPTKAQIEVAIKEIEIVICPICGCKNNYHYKECNRVSRLFKK